MLVGVCGVAGSVTAPDCQALPSVCLLGPAGFMCTAAQHYCTVSPFSCNIQGFARGVVCHRVCGGNFMAGASCAKIAGFVVRCITI